MSRILIADGYVAGRPYVLAVSLYALGVWLPATTRAAEHVVVVHQPTRTADEVAAVIAVGRALSLVYAGVFAR